VRGGLGEVLKRLKIKCDLENKEVPNFYEHIKNVFGKYSDKKSREYKDSLNLVMKRNEFDVRVMPLIEHKFGLLYKGYENIDEYHKRW